MSDVQSAMRRILSVMIIELDQLQDSDDLLVELADLGSQLECNCSDVQRLVASLRASFSGAENKDPE